MAELEALVHHNGICWTRNYADIVRADTDLQHARFVVCLECHSPALIAERGHIRTIMSITWEDPLICQACKEAGRLLSAGATEKEVAWAHADCPALIKDAPTLCDCAHVTRTMLNSERIPKKK